MPTRTVIRSYDGLPFKVTSLSPPGLSQSVEFAVGAGATQKLVFRLDPRLFTSEKETQIVIGTDHPNQPTVAVAVVVLPRGV